MLRYLINSLFILLPQEDELNSAAERARLSLQLVQYLSAGEELAMDKRTIDEAKNEEIVGCSDGNSKSDASNKATFELIKEFIQPMSVEEKEYAGTSLDFLKLQF